jgi:nitrite reductase/ring-hydroxylating ferredoxin subunit
MNSTRKNHDADARVICAFGELADPGSRAFSAGSGNWPLRGFVVRRAGQVFAYVNRCPHAGHPLDWQPDRFLTEDRTLIVCGSHGALFEPSTGVCVAGPCVGRSLQAIGVTVIDDRVVLDEDPQLLAQRHE